MKQRYFFELSYKGSDYSGWQQQPNAPSIQEEVTAALSKIHGFFPLTVVGCGRTDAGVHASNYFLHVDLPEKFSPKDLCFKVNGILPKDIVIHRIFPVHPDAHARFDAISRTYHYYIHTKKDPFKYELSTFYNKPLDIAKMNAAAKLLIGKKDFTSFSKLHTDVKTNICDVSLAQWEYLDNNTLRFEITANRFLRNMVRAVVGTLLEVGTEKITPNEVINILEKKDRSFAGTSAPAQGLFLAKIKYPYVD